MILAAAGAAHAQGWPAKPVRMVVAFAPGGSTDIAVRALAELIALAKAKPGLAYATSGSGSIQHMAGEWLAKLAGVTLTHVPYKGGGQAITDLLGGQVPLGSLGNTPLLPHYRAGKLKILAQTTRARSASLPEVPTYAEANRGLTDAAVRERYAQNGLEPVGGPVEQFARQYREDYEKYARLIKELNIKLD